MTSATSSYSTRKPSPTKKPRLFKQELEKFRPHQNRILQANHKQSSLMKELTRTYSDLLQDKRVRGEQNRYEAFSRNRNAVLSKYRKVYQAYTDLQAGLQRAQQFYEEMKDTVESLRKNVESFVENRRSEGGQLLSAIEAAKGSGADREQARLKELMERMSVSPSTQQGSTHSHSPVPNSGSESQGLRRPPPIQSYGSSGGQQSQYPYNPARSPPITPGYQPNGMRPQHAHSSSYHSNGYPGGPDRGGSHGYNPHTYGQISPPAHQQYFSPPPSHSNQYQQQPSTTTYGANQTPQQQTYGQNVPRGWQPPPPPPGPPPQQDYSTLQASVYPSGPGGYASDPRRPAGSSGGGGDPWAGLSGWK